MNIAIVLRKIDVDSSIVDYIERRMKFVFGRTQHAIRKATVTLTDVIDSKGGIDKQCRILIKTEGLADIVVTEKQESLKAAIENGLNRTRRNLAQRLKGRQQSLREGSYRVLRTPLTLDGNLISSEKI